MDYIELYQDCDSILHKLVKEKMVYISDMWSISPNYTNYIIQEFTTKKIATKDDILQALNISV